MRLRTPLSLVFGLLLSATAFGAESWRLTSPSLFEVTVTAIAVDPHTPSTIYAGGYTGPTLRQTLALFRSDDGGFAWRRIQNGLTGLSVVEIVVNPVAPDVVYAGVYGAGVFKSPDRGETWTNVNPSAVPWVNSFAIDRRNPDTLYVALGGSGIYKTVNGGSSWALVSGSFGISGEVVASVFVDPLNSARLYAAAGLSVHRSEDAGATWRIVSGGITAILWIDETDRALFAVAEGGGLVESVDRGETWTPIGAGLPSDAILTVLRSDPTDPAVVYVGTTAAGVFRSANGGSSWAPFNEGISHHLVRSLFIPSSGDPILYAGAGGGLYDYRSRPEFRTTLPAVASLHGVPPAFFHSDIWIFNGSAQSEATVTATYRCLGGSPCSASPQTFTIPPRQVRTFRDIAVSLFNAPESAGAVEFESDHLIVVTSRLYTPDASAPTTGMFVPGRKPEHASGSQVLTSLSHSADPATGFRTNVGFYNGSDAATFVTFAFFEDPNVRLGEITVYAPPRRPLQLNDAEIFQRLGISRDVPSFHCIAAASHGDAPIHAYAAVIDNRSLDPIFVPGQDAAAMAEAKITLPAVAALHGAAGTFFHSDVRVWNASSSVAEVTARFACFAGDCGERVFVVGPRQALAWDNVVTSLFHLPENAGALEFVSEQPIVVTSRLYTPDRTVPTVGMFVPGLPPLGASPAVVLNGLSRPADPASGSRVNVGVFNQSEVAQVVTFRLVDGNGTTIGQTARLFAPREVFQVNDVFAFLNVAGPVETAYCLVEGSEALPLFAYAAVIDNRSQDPIFIPGEDDPEHPPIVPLAPK